MIAQDNLQEYGNPDLYDLENADFEPDGPFFLDWARCLGGAALELGCGTGRVTIPLAQEGIDITGLEAVPAMLARARVKAEGLAIEWVQADLRTFSLPRRFRLIFETGCVFMHMLERRDQRAFLERARAHLEPDGRLVFGVLFPHPENFEPVAEEKDWYSYEDEGGHLVRVSGIESYDPLRQVKRETAFRRWTAANGEEKVQIAPLELRFTFPQEMELLLQTGGFEVMERFGGPDRSPLAADSRFMVYVCRQV